MVHSVEMLRTAYKHRFGKEDIHHAWCNYVHDIKDLNRSNQSVHVRIGYDSKGRALEMLGFWDEAAESWFVFHAMKPKSALIALSGLEDSHAHRR